MQRAFIIQNTLQEKNRFSYQLLILLFVLFNSEPKQSQLHLQKIQVPLNMTRKFELKHMLRCSQLLRKGTARIRKMSKNKKRHRKKRQEEHMDGSKAGIPSSSPDSLYNSLLTEILEEFLNLTHTIQSTASWLVRTFV